MRADSVRVCVSVHVCVCVCLCVCLYMLQYHHRDSTVFHKSLNPSILVVHRCSEFHCLLRDDAFKSSQITEIIRKFSLGYVDYFSNTELEALIVYASEEV